jgi:crossover junction endodeoxyribonuclease RuvC
MSYVVAVDPGLTGAVAIFFECGDPIEVFDMPTNDSGKGFVSRVVDGRELAKRVMAYCSSGFGAGQDPRLNIRAVMERVNAMPTQGVSSMFSLGDSRGCVRGVLQALRVSVSDVPPSKWKRDLGLEIPRELKGEERKQAKKQVKAKSIELARATFPSMTKHLERAKDHGRAEALLIGHWATMLGRLAVATAKLDALPVPTNDRQVA